MASLSPWVARLWPPSLNAVCPTARAPRLCLRLCRDARFTITDVITKPVTKSPAPPFTTSTLQQEAARKLGMTVSQTMMVAQKLYEAGHITYMRTDSLNLSTLAVNAISEEVTRRLGDEYLKVRRYHTNSKGAQEAHEAIRPTDVHVAEIEGTLQERRLYSPYLEAYHRFADGRCAYRPYYCRYLSLDMRRPFYGQWRGVIHFDGFLRVYIEGPRR